MSKRRNKNARPKRFSHEEFGSLLRRIGIRPKQRVLIGRYVVKHIKGGVQKK